MRPLDTKWQFLFSASLLLLLLALAAFRNAVGSPFLEVLDKTLRNPVDQVLMGLIFLGVLAFSGSATTGLQTGHLHFLWKSVRRLRFLCW